MLSPTAGDGALTGALLLRRGAAAAGVEPPLRGDAGLPALSLAGADAPWPERRDGDVDLVAPVEELSALEPAEPVVSAKAIGIDATADPTPRAIASAPTRPT